MNFMRKLASVLIGTYVALAAVSLVVSAVFFPQKEVLAAFRWAWIWSNTVVLFMRYLIPVHIAVLSILVSVSLGGLGKTIRSMVSAIQGPLIALVALTAVYTVLVEYALPAAERARAGLVQKTSVFKTFFSESDTAFKNGRYDEAYDKIAVCLTIDPGEASARDLQGRILLRRGAVPDAITRREVSGAGEGSADASNSGSSGVTARSSAEALSLFEKARESFDAGDLFSAHLFASRAFALDPNRIDAQRLAARAWQKIGETTSPDPATRELFRRKMEGYTALVTDDPLKAYYVFESLKRSQPEDPDVIKYFGLSLEAVTKISFFTDELSVFDSVPGYSGLLFRNSAENGVEEFVFIGKQALIGNDEYFKDVEVARLDSDGARSHFYVPYAKRAKDSLVLFAIDRSDPSVSYKPRYFVGRASGPTPTLLPISFSTAESALLAESVGSLESSNAGELFAMRPVMEKAGFDTGPLVREILNRFFLPVEFLFLSACALIMGIRFKYRGEEKPRFIQLAFCAACAAVAAWRIETAWAALNRSFAGVLAASFAYPVAQVLFVSAQSVLIVIALAALAGQRGGDSPPG
jgi:hypothetical protein